ncbi:MAG: hypothetical protein ABIH23_05735, partial [bacterium]
MRRCALFILCFFIPFIGSKTFGSGGERFRKTSFSKSEHCELLESSSNRIRLKFAWPLNEVAPQPETVYLAIPRCADMKTTFDRWRLEIVSQDAQREILIGPNETTTDEDKERISNILDQSMSSTDQKEFFFHEIRVLKVNVTPDFTAQLKENPQSGNRVVMRQVEMTIEFSGINADPLPPNQKREFSGGFPSLYDHLVLNHEAVDLYRTRPEGNPVELHPDWARVIGADDVEGKEKKLRTNAVKILTRKDSLYALRAEDLRQTGIDPQSIDLSTVSLWSEKQPCYFWIAKPNGNRFDENTAIVFRSHGTDSPYTKDAVFWLVWGVAGIPRRPAKPGVVEESADAQSIHSVTDTLYFEEDHQLGRRSRSLYEWFWTALGKDYDIDLATPGRTADSPVKFSAGLFNRENIRQTVELSAGDSKSVDNISPEQDGVVRLVISATDAVASTTMRLALPLAAPKISVYSKML